MLCIVMMCTTSFEAQGQSRRSGGGSSHSPRTEHRAPSGHSGPATKMSSPRSNSHGSVSRSAAPQASRSHSGSVSRSQASPRVSRSQSAPQVNRSHSGSVSRSQAAPRVSRSQAPQSNRNHSGSVARSSRPNDRPSVTRSPRGSGSAVARGNSPRPGNIDRGSRSGNIERGSRPGNANRGSRPGTVTRSPRPGSGHGSAIAHNSRPGHGPAVGHNPRPGRVEPRPRPSHRAPIYSRPYLEPRHRPMPSYHYGYHYFGHRIHTLPIGYSLIRVGYRDYYYYDGIYYRPYWDGGYYICRPPLGTRIAATLFDMAMTTIAINTIRNEIERARAAAELSAYYAAQNANYTVRTSDDYYNANLLSQAGQDYYYQDGVFYTLKNGEYCVIEAPIGALVDEIPEDYDEIELGGKTYYQVEDTLFKPAIIDGKLRFEVVCNL